MKRARASIAPAVAILVLLGVVVSSGEAQGPNQSRLVKNGCYLYQFPPAEEGRNAEGNSIAVSFGEGRLTDGDLEDPGEAVSWAPGTGSGAMSIVVDLLTDRILEKITVVAGPSPIPWHGMQTAAVSGRASSDPKLGLVGMELL